MLKHTPSSFPFRDSNTLTAEQSEIIKVAEAGHNILVTGQAGTGKSTLVHALQKDLPRKGRKHLVDFHPIFGDQSLLSKIKLIIESSMTKALAQCASFAGDQDFLFISP